tara:strand:- start:1013 stop:1615 length:603 start_codon:yes stop_codon:yes gene_type:complete
MKNQILASPNSIIWHYLSGLRRNCQRCINEKNPDYQKEDAAQCVMLSVTIVDAFLNLYFQVFVNTEKYNHAKDKFDSDLKRKISIDQKIKEWPKLIFGNQIDLGQGSAQRFYTLKNKRNALVHFSSSFERLNISNIVLNGLADISQYTSLTPQDAIDAVAATEDFMREVFRVSGTSEENIPHEMHLWAGTVSVKDMLNPY